MMMTLAEIWEKEGETRGMTRGMSKGKIASVILVLESRFNDISPALREKLLELQDEGYIEALLKLAATCQNLEDFQKAL